jgi:hypothetical protein
MTLRAILFAGFTSLLISATPSQAGRPLVTEDAGVLDSGTCELESFGSRLSEAAGTATSGASAQVGCGIGWRTQVALAAARERSAGATAQVLAFGGKTGLVEAEQGTSWTLAWGFLAFKPDGGSLRHDASYLNAVASRPLTERLMLHANLGWLRSRSADESSTNWNLALEHAWLPTLDVMGEVFGSDRDHSPWVQLALRWAVLPQKIHLDGGWATRTGSSHARIVTFGLKLSF